MADFDWEEPALKDDGEEELDVGALLREAFDPAKGELPPLFYETVLLSEGLEEKMSRQERKALEERLLRHFFSSIGKDYDAWRRERWRKWLKWCSRALVVVASLAALILGSGAPVPWLWPVPPAPGHFQSVGEIQPWLSTYLPSSPPAGYLLAGVTMEWSPAGTPGAALAYRQVDGAATATLVVRAAQDDAIGMGLAEPIELTGRPAWRVGQEGGGWVLWEEGGWQLWLGPATLSRQELCVPGAELAGRR